MMTEGMKRHYDARLRLLIRELTIVNRMKPKEQFIYRIMDGVPFKDLETAIMMAKIDYEGLMTGTSNDNEQA